MLAIEGFGWLIPGFDNEWKNSGYQEMLTRMIRNIENDESVMGMSAHIMAVARKSEKLLQSKNNQL
jgi:ABC-type Fe3+ transport system substrate-binding protein